MDHFFFSHYYLHTILSTALNENPNSLSPCHLRLYFVSVVFCLFVCFFFCFFCLFVLFCFVFVLFGFCVRRLTLTWHGGRKGWRKMGKKKNFVASYFRSTIKKKSLDYGSKIVFPKLYTKLYYNHECKINIMACEKTSTTRSHQHHCLFASLNLGISVAELLNWRCACQKWRFEQWQLALEGLKKIKKYIEKRVYGTPTCILLSNCGATAEQWVCFHRKLLHGITRVRIHNSGKPSCGNTSDTDYW